ncbi:MAG: SGNH/GDSL hydrolase family protein [Aeromicrobium sp.]
MTLRRRLVASLTLVLAVGACSSGSGEPDPAPSSAASASPTRPASSAAPGASAYVALGDSFTAGPGIGTQQPDAGFCQRSTTNWPSLVAAATGLELTDVSCVGATTADLASTVTSGVVGEQTRLVTVGVGGNDGGLFTSLLTACVTGATECGTYVDGELPTILDRTTDDVVALLEQVRTAAPAAEIVLVGYPRIMPDDRSCDVIGIVDGSAVVTAETALDRSLGEAAERAGVEHVSVRAESTGHDACSGDAAWTNGRAAADGDGISFHPTALGMQAVADAVVRAAGA